MVFADADLEAAAYGIAWGIYYNSGETCHAGSRLIVHESVKDALIEAIVKVTESTITMGHPLDPGTQMGALIDQGHTGADARLHRHRRRARCAHRLRRPPARSRRPAAST